MNRKNCLTSLVFLLSCLIHAQEKKTYYFNEVSDRITSVEFKNGINYQFNLPRTVENDTAVFNLLIARQSYGQLNSEERKQFFQLLEKTTNNKVDTSTTVIINFFHGGEGKSIKHHTRDRPYISKTRKIKELTQFFITEKGYFYSHRKPPVFEDAYDIIRRLFFPIHFRGGNYLIIKPDGSFYRYYGEYPQSEIIPKALSTWKTTVKN
tara:strand:+ start:94103 stop:94726 length:624 start_codon:yes stop_codon:yes gene_type:complete